ncbi:MAG: DNA repair protein RecO C-terminal domain-containing protein [Saccharospirillaceae bacterium]|nr:DNA repair protein RecO C-terminal domain-containing protein [Saccharospirillaceae bacterium]
MKKLFVLQRQPVGEYQFLLDIFSAEAGRLSVVTPQRSAKQDAFIPDCFQQCQADWRVGEDWPQIKALQRQRTFQLRNNSLYCGLYLNELLARLLPRNEPAKDLFLLYASVINALEDNNDSANGGALEPWLRLFEYQLLQQLGLGFSWQQDSLARPITLHQRYRFNPQEGFYLHGAGFFRGSDILAFAGWLKNFAEVPHDVSVWQTAKQVLRLALEHVLERPLISRQLFNPSKI